MIPSNDRVRAPSPNSTFASALTKFFGGERDDRTIELVGVTSEGE